MKTIIPLVFLLLLTSFDSPTDDAIIKVQKEDFSWLIGAWQRSNEKEGQQTFEHWKKQSKDVFVGMGCTLKNSDTIWKEDIILRKTDHWRFEVRGQGEDEPTVFKITEISEHSFTCQNPENEFPKVIHYEKSATGLKAVISGGGATIPFEFKKID